MFLELFIVFIATFLGTGALNIIFRFLGKRGYMGNLYEPVRGGTPRGIGIIPFIVISLFLHAGFNNLVLVMGLCALVDDVIGRRRIANLPIEIGQLARGIGMLCVIGLGYPLMGISSILVALMIQPMNIADMQPGSAVSVVIVMSRYATRFCSKRSCCNELLYNSCYLDFKCSSCSTDSCILCSIAHFSYMYRICSFRLFRKNHVG